MSILLQVREVLEAADPRDLLRIGHDERLRLADTFRNWAHIIIEADRLARVEAMLSPVLKRIGPGRPQPATSRPSLQETHCKRGHLLTEDNVYYRGDSSFRYCKACRAARQRAARRQLRAFRRSALVQPKEIAQ